METINNSIAVLVRNLNPITKLLIVFCLGIGCLIYPLPFVGYGVLCLLVILGILIGQGKKVLKLIFGFGIPVTLMLLFIQGLYSPKNKTMIADFGFAQMGLEGTMYALKISSTLLIFLAAFYLMLQTTKNSETVAALTKSGLHMQIGYLILASLNVVPQMQRKVKVIQEAQESRGVETSGTFIQRAKAFLPLIGPVVLSSLTDAQERGMTLETRGFGISGVKPTSYIKIETTGLDIILRIIAVCFLISSLALRFL